MNITGRLAFTHPVARIEAEFARAKAMESLSYSQAVSLQSPDCVVIRFSNWWRNIRVAEPTIPVFYGDWLEQILAVIPWYLFRLRSSAAPAADPGVIAELITELAV